MCVCVWERPPLSSCLRVWRKWRHFTTTTTTTNAAAAVASASSSSSSSPPVFSAFLFGSFRMLEHSAGVRRVGARVARDWNIDRAVVAFAVDGHGVRVRLTFVSMSRRWNSSVLWIVDRSGMEEEEEENNKVTPLKHIQQLNKKASLHVLLALLRPCD